MNDDFLHDHRREPDAEFGAALYQQLLDADQTLTPTPVPAISIRAAAPKRRAIWLRLVATLLMILAAGVVALQSSNHSVAPNLAQIDTRLLLDDLPPITLDNASQLIEVARLGKGRANAIAYSPDGKTLAVSTSTSIVLYNADLQSDPRLLRTTHNNYARPVAFSADGQQVATIDGDAVHIWDTENGAQTALLEVDAGSNLSTLQFSPDGHWLAAGGGTLTPASFSLYVWHTLTGNLMGKLNLKLVPPVQALAFSPDVQNVLAVQNASGTNFYDPTLTIRMNLETTTNNTASGIAFSPDGLTLAIAHQGEVALWNAHTRQPIQTIPVGTKDTAFVQELTYSPDGSLLAIADLNYGIIVWDVKAGKFLRPPQHLNIWQEISNLVFSPDSSKLALIRYGKTIIVQDSRTGREFTQRTDYDGARWDLSLNADNVTTATFGFDGSIQIHNLKTGELLNPLVVDTNRVIHLAFSPDGQNIAVSGYNSGKDSSSSTIIGQGIKLLNWKTGEEIARFGSDVNLLFAFTFASDGRLFAYDPNGSQPRTLWWDVDHPDEEHTLLSDTLLQAQELQLSRDGSLLASYGYNVPGQTHVFDTASGNELTIPGLDQYAPDRIALSPDGSTLALVSSVQPDKMLVVFDLKRKSFYLHPLAPSALLYSITFSSDSKLIAAAGINTLNIFDASSGQPLYQGEDDLAPVNKLAFSSDGRYIVGSAYDGYIRVWGVPPED